MKRRMHLSGSTALTGPSLNCKDLLDVTGPVHACRYQRDLLPARQSPATAPSPASGSNQRHMRVESNKISSLEGEDIWISLGSKIGVQLTDMSPS